MPASRPATPSATLVARWAAVGEGLYVVLQRCSERSRGRGRRACRTYVGRVYEYVCDCLALCVWRFVCVRAAICCVWGRRGDVLYVSRAHTGPVRGGGACV